jgi:glycosyltransferase involved in cell wall biosynthesis
LIDEMTYSMFDGRLALLQRVLPSYRSAFFEALAARCKNGLHLLAGQPRPSEAIHSAGSLNGIELTMTRNLHFSQGKSYLCFQGGVIRWLIGSDPDALIAEANPRYLTTPPAVRWMHAQARPVIGWGLGAPGSGMRSGIRAPFIHQFDALITYSQTGAEQYARLGFPHRRIFVAPNATARRPSLMPPERPLTLKGKACVLFVGRLQERKKVDSLILACAQLPESLRPRLVIIGDGPARANLEILASKHYPATEFAGGVHGDDLAPWFVGADLFVLPGTGGLALQQAMAFGLPVVAGVADGTQADLVTPANGWQLTDDTPVALGKVLGEALSDIGRLRSFGEASHRIVRDEINVERMVEVFLTAIEQASSQDKGKNEY